MSTRTDDLRFALGLAFLVGVSVFYATYWFHGLVANEDAWRLEPLDRDERGCIHTRDGSERVVLVCPTGFYQMTGPFYWWGFLRRGVIWGDGPTLFSDKLGRGIWARSPNAGNVRLVPNTNAPGGFDISPYPESELRIALDPTNPTPALLVVSASVATFVLAMWLRRSARDTTAT